MRNLCMRGRKGQSPLTPLVCVAAIALGASTYAWFVSDNTVII